MRDDDPVSLVQARSGAPEITNPCDPVLENCVYKRLCLQLPVVLQAKNKVKDIFK
jgi:hypothetical protein